MSLLPLWFVLCVGAGLVPARIAAIACSTGGHKTRPYEFKRIQFGRVRITAWSV